ncbi:MAG: leucine-rich repeat domain-containing protein [Clostridiales bacterium]|nr:leucine-rich repeat domain-containing protein [Clostridiales bacterium]
MRKNRVGIILLSLIFVFAVFMIPGNKTVQASAEILYSGKCGENATWTIDDEGTLTVSGTGRMYDYDWYGTETYSPWYGTLLGDDMYSSPRLTAKVNKIVIGRGITYIGKNAFRQCEAATSVVIPDTVTEIAYGGFWQCFHFTSVKIPGNVKKLGEYSFANCWSITSLTIEEGVEEIGASSFASCSNIPSIVLPSTVKYLGQSAFNDCPSVTYIHLPDGIESLPPYVCSRCTNLETIELPKGLKSIGTSAFSNTGLTSIVIPEGITDIPEDTFNGCNKLESVTLPSTLKSIGVGAFGACEVLPSIDLPEALESIGERAFSGCEALTSIELPSKISVIPDELFNNCGITAVTFKGKVTSIGSEAFARCKGLKTLAIPEGVKTIGDYAFSTCLNLRSITVPSSVTSIGESVFAYCNSLEDIFLYANPKNLQWVGFDCYNLGYNLDFNPRCHVAPEHLEDYTSGKFMLEYFSTKVIVLGDLIDLNIGEHLAGYSLSLEGDIGVNFYMFLDDATASSSTAKMVFTVSSLDGTDVSTQELKVTSAEKENLGGRVCYKFKCRVSSKEMTSTITAQMIDGEAGGQKYEYSVAQYAKYILDHQDRYGRAQRLVKAMLNYGAASQRYFNYNTATLADSFLSEEDRTPDYLASSNAVRFYNYTGNGKVNDDISLYMVNLVLKSEITMNLYFTGVPDGAVFKLGDKTLPAKKSGEYTIVSIRNIPIQKLNDPYEITVSSSGSSLGSITYSPMNYCYNVIVRETSETRTEALKKLVSSLYFYNLIADDYASIL